MVYYGKEGTNRVLPGTAGMSYVGKTYEDAVKYAEGSASRILGDARQAWWSDPRGAQYRRAGLAWRHYQDGCHRL